MTDRNDAPRTGVPLALRGYDDRADVLPDPNGVGAFLCFTSAEPFSRREFAAGTLTDFVRFTCVHRYEPFWMKAACGTRLADLPTETQFLLAERTGEPRYAVLVPLLDGPARAALAGTPSGGVRCVVETGDPDVGVSSAVALFVATGDDPFALVRDAARSVAAHAGTGRLRTEKSLPAFVESFGWCTWDAFYRDVSHEKVRSGLESFAAGGVRPGFVILDDGWQSTRKSAGTDEERLTSFAPNGKFPQGLAPTVRMAKDEFGVSAFLVWHAVGGYWGGVAGDALPGYGVRDMERRYSPSLEAPYTDNLLKWFGARAGVVPPRDIYRFYQDYHRSLRAQGVDGVKVDNQSSLESTVAGFGVGRAGLMRAYHEALEGSAQVHFGGALINCMSCSSDMLYNAPASNLTRTSTDFWPNDPASHGLHLYVNAQVSLWFGEFVHPDWDMFQSGHPAGAFHAAGRAVSGSPVYVSDKPGAHDFDLLRRLTLADGSVLRCAGPGRPTRDCLFADPTREDVLLKIFNTNPGGGGGVVGVFNARAGAKEGPRPAPGEESSATAAGAAPPPAPAPSLSGSVRPSDVEGLAGDRFAVYAHHTRELRVLGRDEAWDVTLAPLAAEVFTVAPVVGGVAAVGLRDKLNAGGALVSCAPGPDGGVEIAARGEGDLLLWCERAPAVLRVNGAAPEHRYDARTGELNVALPGPLSEIWLRLDG